MRMKSILPILPLIFVSLAQSKENVNQVTHKSVHIQTNCTPSTSNVDLDIGNVRARILMNGDMWWDMLGNAKYEVPKNSGKHSLAAGALWIGGTDAGGQLKVAAQTYRQSGSDFWPGPLDTTNAFISAAVCAQYDRHWKITRQEVQAFVDSFNIGNPITPSLDIQEWPGTGDNAANQTHFLAPFVDQNGDGIYNYLDGDYPAYDLSSSGSGDCCNFLHGDQTIWWVFNDMGNIHTETNGNAIGLEIHAQAFAYNSGITNLDNATFYQYKIINRSAVTLHETYIGQWVDPDLGNYLDDFVGCDVERGMGYCYNGDAFDEGPDGYGMNPPAVGVDFLQGPLADPMDGIDNDRDSTVDEPGEEIIMSKFMYYDNNADIVSGNPSTAIHYFNYLRGIWKDGNKMVYGGNGHYGGLGATNDTCDFMFPGDSDPNHWGTNGVPELPWDQVSAGSTPDDRRFIQSAGPFTMLPGSVTCVTTAAIWARASSGGPMASVDELKLADDQIQQYFNSCFTSFPVSINEPEISGLANVYPNPFHDHTTISFPSSNKQSSFDVVLYNSNGKIVRTYKKIFGKNVTIKRDELSSGIYFYKISGNGNELFSGKLIIID